jgi:poly-gamma-glutamate capsule biosynthesis protein CapA/YwtB (metallophosphatase superfamily)
MVTAWAVRPWRSRRSGRERAPGVGAVRVVLCGDVMLGRGLDQVLPHPGDPALRERSVRDARDYVALAERRNGPLPRPVDWTWPWGDALPLLDALGPGGGSLLDESGPGVRVLNLETAVTRGDDFAAGKAVHYRMSPDNLPALTVARPDVCVLANNHVLDFGRRGLAETLGTLSAAGLRSAGAGADLSAAQRPAVVPLPGGGRLLVAAIGLPSSGVPLGWAATPRTAGVWVLPEASDDGARQVCAVLDAVRRPGDVTVVSVHWGSNWGFDVPPEHVAFAHRLVEDGVDVVHGHSSHHPRPVEVYRRRLVLYGCGDLVNDYEGISGYERFCPDLRVVHVADVDAGSGELVALRLVPLHARRLRLDRASAADTEHLRRLLGTASAQYGSRVEPDGDGGLAVRWR